MNECKKISESLYNCPNRLLVPARAKFVHAAVARAWPHRAQLGRYLHTHAAGNTALWEAEERTLAYFFKNHIMSAFAGGVFH